MACKKENYGENGEERVVSNPMGFEIEEMPS